MSQHIWPAVMCAVLLVAMSFGLKYFSDTWFFSTGVLGVGIVFAAIMADLDRDVAGPANGSSYARQLAEADRPSRPERTVRRSQHRTSLSVVKLVGAIFVVFGFGGFLLTQYGGVAP